MCKYVSTNELQNTPFRYIKNAREAGWKTSAQNRKQETRPVFGNKNMTIGGEAGQHWASIGYEHECG
jgi:hypothetical protein